MPPSKWVESETVYSELIGNVSGWVPGPVPLTVRVVSRFGRFSKDGFVGRDGSFEIDGVPDGDSLVLVLEDFRIRGEARISKTPQVNRVTVPVQR